MIGILVLYAALSQVQTSTAVIYEGEGESIVITGSRTESKINDAAVAVEVIDRRMIDESGAENLTDILEDAPGLQITHNLGRAGVELQGLDPQYTLILIDGQRATGRVNGVLDLNRFPAERIERVEIVKGAVSALYGADALAGVINIITRRSKNDFEGEAHLSYGNYSLLDGSLLVGWSGEKYNLRISGGFHHGNSYQIASTNRIAGDPSTSGPGFNEANGDIRAEYDLTDDDRLTLRADYLFRDADSVAATPILQRDESYLFQTFVQGNRTENYSVALTHERRFPGEVAKVTSSLYYNGWREQFLQDVKGVKGDIPVLTNERLGQANVQYDELMGAHMITIGSELLYETLEASERICRELEQGSCVPSDAMVMPDASATADGASRVRFATYFQDELVIFDEPRLVVVPGIRADIDSLFGTYPTPKIALRFDPISQVVLRAGFGLGFRAPSFRELYLSFTNPSANYHVSGNPELEPETSRSFNAGADFKPFRELRFSVNYFRNDLTNLIDFGQVRPPSFGQVGLYEYVNVLEARTQGVETSATLRPWRYLTVNLGYTYLDAVNLTLGTSLIGRAHDRIEGSVRYEETFTDMVFFTRLEWVGRRPFEAPEGDPQQAAEEAQGPAYLMLDARIEKRIGTHFDVFFGGANLLDASDSQFLLIRPRTIYGGVTARL